MIYAIAVAVNVGLLACRPGARAGRAGLGVGTPRPPVAGPVLLPPTGRARTAVLLPMYEEDATRIRRRRGDGRSLNSEAWVRPTCSSSVTRARPRVRPRGSWPTGGCWQRPPAPRRSITAAAHDNTGRKAGNIAEFIGRWGADYDFMVVLDADSLMTGAAIARLVGAMEANPNAGLIQTMCYAVGRSTLFARMQQFGARLYGPMLARGVALWQGPRGSYWGHNAIIRIAAFAAIAACRTLPGRAPLGGEILCHDTVEAALLLRAGWDVWMLPDGPDGRHGLLGGNADQPARPSRSATAVGARATCSIRRGTAPRG